MVIMSNYIKKLEAHTDLEASIIRATKVHKVLKAIVKMDSIPKDEDYQFRRRSMDILFKWKDLLAESDVLPGEAETRHKESNRKPNGAHRQSDAAEGRDGDSIQELLEALEATVLIT
jgi:hypothetical protein